MTCLQEVALEGLDGITLPTLWQRLDKREQNISVVLTDALKAYLWKYLVDHNDIELFVLDKERQVPVIFDW